MLKYKYYRARTPEPTPRRFINSPQSFHGSNSSLASSTDGSTMGRRKKGKAPPPPLASTSATSSPVANKSVSYFKYFLWCSG